MFLFQNTLYLHFLRKSSLCIGSYPRTLIIGNTTGIEFDAEKSFVFDLSNFVKFYVVLTDILQEFRQDKNTQKEQYSLFALEPYYWQMSQQENLKLCIKKQDSVLFEVSFNYIQFNELLYAVSECIMPCLCLKNEDYEFFNFVLSLNVETRSLIKYSMEIDNFSELIKETPYVSQKFKVFSLLKLNLDVLFVLLKLKKFVLSEFLPNDPKTLLESVKV